MIGKLINQQTKEVLVPEVSIASNFFSRLKGLIGTKKLEPGQAMYITRSGNSIHTCFMSFAIDLCFVDNKGFVHHLVRNLKPWRIAIAPTLKPRHCLEFSAGSIDRLKIKIGDQLRVET